MNRTAALASVLENTVGAENAAVKGTTIAVPNTVNKAGGAAYSVPKFERLLRSLVTKKLTDRFYSSMSNEVVEFKNLFTECANENPELVAKMIIFARCMSDGMRTVNQFAAALLAPYASGTTWGSRFYSSWDRKSQSGGMVYRLDDMTNIVSMFKSMHGKRFSNAMKRAFASNLENAQGYELAKYKKSVIDLARITHADPRKSTAKVTVILPDGSEEVRDALPAIIGEREGGYRVHVDTWDSALNEIGVMLAASLKAGKITEAEKTRLSAEHRRNVWLGLITEKKLGMQAALMNGRNILQDCEDGRTNSKELVQAYCDLISNGDLIRRGKVMPHQLHVAKLVLQTTAPDGANLRSVLKAIDTGIETSLPNMQHLAPGRNLVVIDVSGSMSYNTTRLGNSTRSHLSCAEVAAFLGAVFAKALNSDVILFDTDARYVSYDPNNSLSGIAAAFHASGGATHFYKVWDLITQKKKAYDRVFVLSDNCDYGKTIDAGENVKHGVNQTVRSYSEYVKKVADPYVYSIDLESYGTSMLESGKTRHYYGYGTQMFDDIANNEFSPAGKIQFIEETVVL